MVNSEEYYISDREKCRGALRRFHGSFEDTVIGDPFMYLVNHSKPEREINPQHYQLKPHQTCDLYNLPLTFDASNVLALYGRNEEESQRFPLAFASFEMEPLQLGPSAIVYQLQAGAEGKTARSPLLNGLRWEVMFLRMISDWARSEGLGCASISAPVSHWYEKGYKFAVRNNPDLSLEEFQGNMKRRYHGAARRAKFSYDSSTRLWLDRNSFN